MENNDLDIGVLVDMPLDEFKSQVIRSRMSIGSIRGYYAILLSIYDNLSTRKDGIISLVTTGKKNIDEVREVLSQLYSEMQKIEDKTLFLKTREKTLLEMEL